MAITTTKRDLAWSYISYGVSIGTNFILLPIILKFLSGSELGLWYSFLSVGGIIVLLDFGFAQTIMRNVTYCYSGAKILQKTNMPDLSENITPNYQLLKGLIASCRLLYFCIAAIATVLLFTIGTVYVQYISKELEGSLYIIAWGIYSFGIVLNFYFGYFPCLLMGVGAIAQANKATLIARLLQIVISVIGLVTGFGIIALGAAFLINGISMRLISQWYFKRYMNIAVEIKKQENHITMQEVISTLKILWHNAWRTGVSSFGGFLISQSNTIMCSLFLGLAVTGIYGLSMQIVTVVGAIAQILFNAYMPALTESCIKKDMKRIKQILSVSVVSNLLIYWIGIITLCFIGLPILKIIKPNSNIPLEILLFIALSIFLERNQWIFCGYIVATNRIPFMLPNIISGITIAIFSYVLIGQFGMGIWGLVLSNFLVMLIYNYWKWMLLVLKELKISIKGMFIIGVSEIVSKFKQLKDGIY